MLRRISTTGRDLPANTYDICRRWLDDWFVIFNQLGRDPSKIYNMDETSIYLDFPSSYTFEKKGKRRVKAVTAGSERTRLSAAFTASADGRKSKIYIIIPRETPFPDYMPPDNVIVTYKTGGTFNESIICDYLEQVMSEKSSESTLIIDSARCHLTSKVCEKFNALKLQKVFVMPRMTNLLQPADVGWFAVIKKQLHDKWNEWFLSEAHSFTRFGNMRSPGYVLCIQWLSEIWEQFPEYLIINSFEHCGVTSSGACHSALQAILNEKASIESYIDNYHETDDYDGFTDVDLFENGAEEVLFPLPTNREVDEVGDELGVDQDCITSGQPSPRMPEDSPVADNLDQINSETSPIILIESPIDGNCFQSNRSELVESLNDTNSDKTNSVLPEELIETIRNSLQSNDVLPTTSHAQQDVSHSILNQLKNFLNKLVPEEMNSQNKMTTELVIEQTQNSLSQHVSRQRPLKQLSMNIKNNDLSQETTLADSKSIKRGRKPLPRDENGNIIRQAKKSKKNSVPDEDYLE